MADLPNLLLQWDVSENTLYPQIVILMGNGRNNDYKQIGFGVPIFRQTQILESIAEILRGQERSKALVARKIFGYTIANEKPSNEQLSVKQCHKPPIFYMVYRAHKNGKSL